MTLSFVISGQSSLIKENVSCLYVLSKN